MSYTELPPVPPLRMDIVFQAATPPAPDISAITDDAGTPLTDESGATVVEG